MKNKQVTKKKSMTLDKLAIIMGRSFEHMDQKFTKEFAHVHDRIDDVEERLIRIEHKHDSHDTRIEILEDKVLAH